MICVVVYAHKVSGERISSYVWRGFDEPKDADGLPVLH